MEYNEPLLNAIIKETNTETSDGIFEWHTEWFGYLPFGQYQWIEVNNKDISIKWKFDWGYKDLTKLKSLGLLTGNIKRKI